MSAADLAPRRAASHQAFSRAAGGTELGGDAFASIAPLSPDRSLFNAVTYLAEPPALDLPALSDLYSAAGVRAWTVWVHPGHEALAASLRDAGHHLDATPEAMGADLAALELDGPDVGGPASWEEAIATNAAAYGAPASELRAMEVDADGLHLYGAEGGATVAIYEHEGDAWVTYVAARPEVRGRGLVSALMRQALRDSVASGCTTTTLEATRVGRPVYERLGYVSLGTLQMWEKRAPS